MPHDSNRSISSSIAPMDDLSGTNQIKPKHVSKCHHQPVTKVLCNSSLQRRLEETVTEKSVNENKRGNNPQVCPFLSLAMLSIGRCDGD